MKRAALFLLMLLCTVANGANSVYPLDCEANARAKIADYCATAKQRTTALQTSWAALETKWSLVQMDEATFGFLASASATNFGSITATSKNYTSTLTNWTAADVGKTIHIQGAGPAGATLVTTIAAYVSGTAITLTDAASTTVTASKTSKAGIAVWGFPATLALEVSPLTDGSLNYFRNNLSGDISTAILNLGTNNVPIGTILNGNQIDVRSYGATGDGITNDAAAIQATINAVSAAGGGVVFFPRGTYVVNATRLTIRYSNVTLRGVGRDSVIQWTGTPAAGPFGGTGGLVTIYPHDAVYPGTPGTTLENVVVENLKLVGLHEGIYTAGRQGIEMENVRCGVVRNCYLIYFGAENILFDAALGNYTGVYFVESNEVEGGGNLFNTGGSKATIVRGNYFHDNAFQGVEMASAGQNVVTGNIFRNMAGNIEILMDRNATGRSGTTFTANSIENCQKMYINTQSASQPTNIVVSGNVFRKCNTDFNIQIYGSSNTDAKVLIIGNIMSEMVAGGGINCVTGYGAIITGNTVYAGNGGTCTYGIIGDANAKPVVFGNFVDGPSVGNGITMSNASSVLGENYYDGILKRDDGTRRNGITIANDTAVTLYTSANFTAAGGFQLRVSARGNAVDALNVQASVQAHISSCAFNIVSQQGVANGNTAAAYNTNLTGTTGSANKLNLSAYGSGSAWSIIVENRTGATVTLGYAMDCYTK